MRLIDCSSAASQNPGNGCVTSGRPPDCFQVIATGMLFVPNASCRARAALAPIVAKLPAYDGYGGVGSSGSHVGSGSVAGLRSVAASRIAVTGRHRPNTNLLVCVVISASWMDTL